MTEGNRIDHVTPDLEMGNYLPAPIRLECTSSMRQSEQADISAGEKRSDDIAARDRQIQMRRVRLVVMNRDARGPWPAHVIAREGLQRIYRRLVVGALDAERDALAGLK